MTTSLGGGTPNRQILSTDNTQTVTSAEAQPASPWQGTYEVTRSIGVARILVTLAATDTTEDGLGGTFIFEFSEDGISNNGISETRVITDFQTVRDFDLLNAGAYFRCSFEPDRALSSDSVFITTTLRTSNDGSFVRLANQQIEEANAAMGQQFAYLKGFFEGDGRSTNVRTNERGNLLIADYNVEVARGSITGVSTVRVASRNPSIGTTEQVLSNTSAALAFPTAASTIRIKAGGNVNDTAAGSGARELTVVGVSSTGAVISETIATNGSSASSATTASFLRINSFYVSASGTYATGAIATGANTGIIDVETTGGVLLGRIPANLGTSARAIYSIPLAKTGYLRRLRVTPEGNKNVTFRLWSRKDYTDATAPMPSKLMLNEFTLIADSTGFDLTHPLKLEALEEIWVTGQTSTGTSAGSCAFELLIVDD